METPQPRSLAQLLRSQVARAPLLSMGVVAVGACAAGVLLFWSVGFVLSPQTSGNTSLRLSREAGKFTNPLLLCNVDQGKNFNEDKVLEKKVQTFIDTRIQNGGASNMSLYISNYNTGQWVGVNENDPYDPASLFKVPLMIAYFQSAETNPSLLNQTLTFTGDNQNIDEHYRSAHDIVANTAYTTDDLIKSMILNSDNTAAVLLEQYLDKNSLSEVYTDLNLLPPSKSQPNSISAKKYAYFFRILYNATYLNHAFSEKALALLSQASFPQGIRGGVPASVVVAQKFGERGIYSTDHILLESELHDCGIVYKPSSPYLICIMSRGKNFDALSQNIRDLSSLVYKEIK